MFLVAVSDYIQTKRLKGRNPIPWRFGAILNLIKKKDSIRQKLKLPPSSHLREKLKDLPKTVKRMMWNSRDEFLGSVESDLNRNPQRFLSILKLNSKSHTIPDRVTMPMYPLTQVIVRRQDLQLKILGKSICLTPTSQQFSLISPPPLPFIWERYQCTSFS